MAAILIARDGVDNGIANPQGRILVVVNIVMMAVAALAVAARFCARIKIFHKVGIDDWIILADIVRRPVLPKLTEYF
jgi:hypothetical protein